MISSFDCKKDMFGRQSIEIVVDNMLFVIKGLLDNELRIFKTVLDTYYFVFKEMSVSEDFEINLNSVDKELFESLYEERKKENYDRRIANSPSVKKKEKYTVFEIVRLAIEFLIMIGLFLNVCKIAFDYYFFVLGVFSIIILAEALLIKKTYLRKRICKEMKVLP